MTTVKFELSSHCAIVTIHQDAHYSIILIVERQSFRLGRSTLVGARCDTHQASLWISERTLWGIVIGTSDAVDS